MFTKQPTTNISIIKKSLLMLLGFCSALEILFFPSIANVVGCAVSFASTFMFYKYVFNIQTIRSYPLTFIAVLGLFFFMYLPVLITLMDGNEVSHDMYNPIATYLWQLLYFVLTIVSFRLAARISKKHHGLNKFLNRWGYFKLPTQRQLWALGFMGWIFKFGLMSQQGSGQEVVSAAGTLSMFSMFIYSPILILFLPLMGGKPSNGMVNKFVYTYIGFLCIFLVATNSRSQMLSAFVVFAFCYLLTKIYEGGTKVFFTVKKLIIAVFAVFVITGPMSDMGIAMLATRGVRGDMGFSELLSETLNTYMDKDKLNAYKKVLADDKAEDNVSNSLEWNEDYCSNIFFARLCNYRVADGTIFHAERAGFGNSRMFGDFVDHIKMMFPGPIYSVLFDEEKNVKRYNYSPMDFLYSLSYSGQIFPGFRVGGDVGLGLATFGVAFFLLMVVVYTLEFFFFNSMTIVRNGKLVFSFFVLLSIYYTFFLDLTVASGIIGHIIYLVWGFWWNLLWLLLVYRIVLKIF